MPIEAKRWGKGLQNGLVLGGESAGERRVRRRWPRRLGLCAGLALGVLLMGFWLLLSVPDFYRLADAEARAGGHESARKFVAQLANIYNGLQNGGHWDATLSERSLNAWLAGDGARSVQAALPDWLSEPRVAFEPGRVLLGLRCKAGPLSTVLSVRARVWVPEPEAIAVAVEQVRVGRLRLPNRSVIAWSRKAAEAAKLQIEWKSYEGNPVAIVRPLRPQELKLSVTDLRLTDGSVRVLGEAGPRFRGIQLSPVTSLSGSGGRNTAVHVPSAARLR